MGVASRMRLMMRKGASFLKSGHTDVSCLSRYGTYCYQCWLGRAARWTLPLHGSWADVDRDGASSVCTSRRPDGLAGCPRSGQVGAPMPHPEILPAHDVRELRSRSACDGDSVADRPWYAGEGLGLDREEAAEILCRFPGRYLSAWEAWSIPGLSGRRGEERELRAPLRRVGLEPKVGREEAQK